MKIQFELLRQPFEVRDTLRNHGWRLDSIHNNSVSASHPDVQDETVARNRLNDMGLLTSGSVRITFEHAREHREI
jgi:hypothetical protein